jgi:hypothetical protein
MLSSVWVLVKTKRIQLRPPQYFTASCFSGKQSLARGHEKSLKEKKRPGSKAKTEQKLNRVKLREGMLSIGHGGTSFELP